LARFFLAVLAIVFSIDAFACSCSSYSLHEQLDKADIVMVVRVTQTRLNPEGLKSHQFDDNGPVHATFELTETLKGDPSKVEELFSGYGGGDCGIPLLPGLYYFIVAKSARPMISVDICGASMKLDAVDPRKFGKTAQRFRLDAARAYLRDKRSIDPCFDYADIAPAHKEGGRCEKLISKMLSSDEIK
jgi:hypothetical protein